MRLTPYEWAVLHLPGLRELCLDGSTLTSLRELGSGARNLEMYVRRMLCRLWSVHVFMRVCPVALVWVCSLRVARCSLLSLDGVGLLRSLCELHIMSNHIHDLEPLGSVSAPLAVLDLERYRSFFSIFIAGCI